MQVCPQNYVKNPEDVANIRSNRTVMRTYEGVDVYYEPEKPGDGQTDFWGSLYIHPFPFKATVAYDDGEYVCELTEHDQMVRFIAQNVEMKEVRNLRKRLRCLNGETVYFPWQVRNATGIWENNVELDDVTIVYDEGILRIETKANDMFSNGFKVLIEYMDGYYYTGNDTENRIAIKKHFTLDVLKELGEVEGRPIKQDLSMLQHNGIRTLAGLDNPKGINAVTIESKLPEYLDRERWLREDLGEERRAKHNQMTWTFWAAIFDDDRLGFADIERYFMNCESNPELKTLTKLYRHEFEALYSRMMLFDAHPVYALWYLWWDDIAVKNGMLKQIESHPELFDLRQPTALAYHPMKWKDLNKKLIDAGLRRKNGRGFFSDAVIGPLYVKINEMLGKNDMADEQNTEEEDMTATERKRSSWLVPGVEPPVAHPPQEMDYNVAAGGVSVLSSIVTENVSFLATAFMAL